MEFLQCTVLGLLGTLRSLWVFISVLLCGSGVCTQFSRSDYPYFCVVLGSLEVCKIIKTHPLNYLVNWICFASSGTGS